MLIGVLKPIAFQNHDKKVLSEILSFLGRATVPARQRRRLASSKFRKARPAPSATFVRQSPAADRKQAPARGGEHARLGFYIHV